jgi:hypothetical protein
MGGQAARGAFYLPICKAPPSGLAKSSAQADFPGNKEFKP